MAKLILSMEGLVLKEIPLVRERTTIGRKPHNDIQIDNLAISGEHAVIVTVINDSFLEDLDSTNGTLVNGQPVKKHFLQDGDVIELETEGLGRCCVNGLRHEKISDEARRVADGREKSRIGNDAIKQHDSTMENGWFIHDQGFGVRWIWIGLTKKRDR